MKKSILVISGSARKDSDTKKYADYLLSEIAHTHIPLAELNILPYSYEGIYNDADEFEKVIQAMLAHNIIIFATPVYWYAMSALMKNMFDRLTDLVTIDKPTGRSLKGKYIFLVAVGTDAKLPEGFDIPFKRTAEYFDMNYVGSYYGCTRVDYDISLKNVFMKSINAVSL